MIVIQHPAELYIAAFERDYLRARSEAYNRGTDCLAHVSQHEPRRLGAERPVTGTSGGAVGDPATGRYPAGMQSFT